MNDVALELRGITKAYNLGAVNEVTVLRGIDLTLKGGEVVALVAPSGAGKSTLLHIAGLLDTPDAGQVHIGGVDMTGQSDRRRTAGACRAVRRRRRVCRRKKTRTPTAVALGCPHPSPRERGQNDLENASSPRDDLKERKINGSPPPNP